MKVDGVSSRIVREYKGFLQAHGLLIWLNCIQREREHLPPRQIQYPAVWEERVGPRGEWRIVCCSVLEWKCVIGWVADSYYNITELLYPPPVSTDLYLRIRPVFGIRRFLPTSRHLACSEVRV